MITKFGILNFHIEIYLEFVFCHLEFHPLGSPLANQSIVEICRRKIVSIRWRLFLIIIKNNIENISPDLMFETPTLLPIQYSAARWAIDRPQ